jgi:hypothetical protein
LTDTAGVALPDTLVLDAELVEDVEAVYCHKISTVNLDIIQVYLDGYGGD